MLVPSRTGESSVHVGGSTAHGGFVQGATALKRDLKDHEQVNEHVASDAEVRLGFSSPEGGTADLRRQARMKGYVGEACPECGNFTMVRNGTCLKCDTCGGTTGCS
jgi:ribonucleoside-diphosphate reductase alpha chain